MLDQFEQEIEQLKLNPDVWAARQQLRFISVKIRRMLWSNRERAYQIAKSADEAANAIESQTDGMMATDRLPRFDGLVSGGIWHEPIK
jgi:hypothetical protein